jgi:hypothetical protein
MGELDVRTDLTQRDATERVAESVRRALKLVGPAEGGGERVFTEEPEEEPAASR